MKSLPIFVSLSVYFVVSEGFIATPTSTRTPISSLKVAPGRVPNYPPPRDIDESLLQVDSRPGAIVETQEQLVKRSTILEEVETGARNNSPEEASLLEEYGALDEVEQAEYDIDDSEAIDSSTLAEWTIEELESKFDYEWDPRGGEPDPNHVELNQEGVRYLNKNPVDEEGVELGYNPIFGPSNPIDTRTIMGTKDSFMIDEATKDDTMLQPLFPKENDLEKEFNEDVVQFRKSLDILETYVDPFLNVEVPRHVAKWHGYPEPMHFESKPYENNRFTDKPTDFDSMDPFRARQRAIELARSRNAEWMPREKSLSFHQEQRQSYEEYGTDVGTLRRGDCNPDLVEQIQPALDVLGSSVDLLSIIDDTIYRFYYHGLMKNKYGMKCWTETMLRDCGVEVTGVIFETGFRRRDPAYDGGDHWYGPQL